MLKTTHESGRRRGSIVILLLIILAATGFAAAADPPLPGTWEGTYYSAHLDLLEDTEVILFYGMIDTVTGKDYRLIFESDPPGEEWSGGLISVTGVLLGDTITVTEYELTTPPPDKVLDELSLYNVAVILVNFEIDGTVNPLECSASTVENLMFTDPGDRSVDDLYMETSYGQLGFYGDVYGPFDVLYTEETSGSTPYYNCLLSYRTWMVDARAAALAAGFTLTGYNMIVYVYSQPNICVEAGIGGVASLLLSNVNVFHCGIPSIYAHEIGHNFGLRHAFEIDDNGALHYDYSDIMGGVWKDGVGWVPARGMNAPHKIQMDWIAEEQIVRTSECGVFELNALELPLSQATGPQVVEIPLPDGSGSYYLSYRSGIGFDANLLPDYIDKLNVHTWSGLIHNDTYFEGAFDPGEGFVDEANDFAFNIYERDEDSALVEVLIDPGIARSTATMEPPFVQGAPDVVRTFTMTVNNEDCLERTWVTRYEMTGAIPGEFNVSMSQTSFTLAPGESTTVTIEAYPDFGIGEGSHTLAFLADGGKTIHKATAEADYIIDYYPPTIPENMTAGDGLSPVTVKWSPSTDTGAGVSHYILYRNDVFLTEVELATYDDRDVTPGYTYTYKAKAVDRVGKESDFSESASAFVTSLKIPYRPNKPGGDE